MTTLILEEARRLLVTTQRVRGYYAFDEHGFPVCALNADAAGFCLIGALYRAAHNLKAGRDYYAAAVEALYEETGTLLSLAEWNDLATDEEVLGALDRLLTPVEA